MAKSRKQVKEKPAPRSAGRKWTVLGAVLGVAVIAAVVVAFAARRSTAPLTATAGRTDPDIILITIDTLRADSVGFAGNARVRTPFMDRLANEGIAFTEAHAHNVVTLPSHTNILTGLYPYQHGVRDNAGFHLDPKYPTVATMLKADGYTTGAFVGAFPLDSRFGLNQGFDEYDDRYREGTNSRDFVMAERTAPEVLTAAMKWYEQVRDRKKFLWIHLYDPHAPYAPPPPFDQQYRDEPYLGEVAATDAAMQKFLGPVLANGRDTLVILTADHGESLGEHGELTHGLFAYEGTLHIPLVIWEPGTIEHRVESRPVRHVDIVPTILDRVGVKVPKDLPGRSLLKAGGERDSYFESLSASLNRGWAPLIGMIHGDYKYVDLPLPELYRLSSDPKETTNLVDDQRRTAFEIRELLASSAPTTEVAGRNVSPDEAARLRSLGYLAGTAAKKDYTAADDPKNLVELDAKSHEVLALYQKGRIDEAIALAREILAERPEMANVRETLSFLLQQDEKPAEAIATIRKAIREGIATDAMRRRLGMLLSENGHAAEAVQVLSELDDADDPDFLNAYGIALADTGNLDEAVRKFQHALAVDHTNATAYQNLGIVELRAGSVEQARQSLMKALDLNDEMPLALNTLGVLYAKTGNLQGAIDAWTRATAVDPHQYDALFNLSMVAGRAGQLGVAENALRKFIDTAPPERYGKDIDTARRMLAELQRRGR